MITIYGVDIDEKRITEILILPFKVQITTVDNKGGTVIHIQQTKTLHDVIRLLEVLEGCKE